MANKNSFTFKLEPYQQSVLTDILKHGNYRPIQREHTIIAAETPNCNIALYKSGKCLIQGKGAEDFVSFVMEPMVLKTVQLGYEDIINPEAIQPHMGIDESGKGDFFGPIVIAGAYTDEKLSAEMRDMNVRDSKNIKSDTKALDMGRELRKLLGKRFSLVKIGPDAYNRLYAKMRSVNTLLAWGHARAIENLLETVPGCPRALSDQFGKKEQVQKALMKKGRSIELEQKHKAESDIAVAAASILAREAFLRSLKDLAKLYDMDIPKGVSASVREAAIELAKKHGPDILQKTVKCHFKTTDEVLSALGTDRKVLAPECQVKSKLYGAK